MNHWYQGTARVKEVLSWEYLLSSLQMTSILPSLEITLNKCFSYLNIRQFSIFFTPYAQGENPIFFSFINEIPNRIPCSGQQVNSIHSSTHAASTPSSPSELPQIRMKPVVSEIWSCICTWSSICHFSNSAEGWELKDRAKEVSRSPLGNEQMLTKWERCNPPSKKEEAQNHGPVHLGGQRRFQDVT